MRDVALEVPLGPFDLGRLHEGDNASAARIQVLGEALDRASLAGRIASLEQDDDPLPGLLDPVLQLEQLDLEQALFVVVRRAIEAGLVGKVLAPGVQGNAGVIQQDRVVVIVVDDRVALGDAVREGNIQHYARVRLTGEYVRTFVLLGWVGSFP